MFLQRVESAQLSDSKSAEAYFAGRLLLCDPSTEHLFVAHLDHGSRCLNVSHYPGESCSAELPVRQIIAEAIALGSAGLVLAHNHPSGDSRPSDSDCRATRRLASVGEAIDCFVLDHLVFGGRDCTSFRQLGLI